MSTGSPSSGPATETPVLWVSGAPGTGKSTTGWGLFTRIARRGGSVAYVDIDQLGLIGPPTPDGPTRHRTKIDNLLGVLANLRRRGVAQVIVSGVVDPEHGIAVHLADRAAWAAFTLVRLRCDPDELRRRYLGRGSSPVLLAELTAPAEQLDRTDIGQPLDTTDHTPTETVDALLDRCVVAAPADGGPLRLVHDGERSPRVVVVAGASAVGKSTALRTALGLHVHR